MTSSLFATAVAASFFVVAVPHMLPCPAPRVKYADSEVAPDGTRRRRRRAESTEVKDGIAQFETGTEGFENLPNTKAKRECPLPRPGGVIGNLMGFNKDQESNVQPGDEQ